MSNFFEKRRNELGLTQRKIAESFNPHITPAAVSQWERNVTAPEMTQVEEVARVYRVSKSRILEAIHRIAMTRKESASAGK